MRKTLALLALLATAWSHVAALECALQATPASRLAAVEHGSHEAPALGAAHHGHLTGGAHGGESHPGEDDAPGTHADGRAAEHGGDACTLVMACGVAMVGGADAPSDTPDPSPSTAAPLTQLAAPEAISLAAEPPPPRRNA